MRRKLGLATMALGLLTSGLLGRPATAAGPSSVEATAGRSLPATTAVMVQAAARTEAATPDVTGPGQADPPSSEPMGPTALAECDTWPSDTGVGCQDALAAAFNRARAREGLGPLLFPANYRQLRPVEQMLVLYDLERTARGLPPIIGLTHAFDAATRRAVARGTDPVAPAWIGPRWWEGNWGSGPGGALLIVYVMMYDDGASSSNIDCTPADPAGCWGHRRNILFDGFGANRIEAEFTARPAPWGVTNSAYLGVEDATYPLYFRWSAEASLPRLPYDRLPARAPIAPAWPLG